MPLNSYRLRSALFSAAAFFGAVDVSSNLHAQERVHENVLYNLDFESEYEKERCRLNLFMPAEGTKDFPTIVWFHGGALRGGDKEGEIETNAGMRFAKEGIGFVSVNYRLDPKVGFPAYVEDAAEAVAFVRRSVKNHGGDPERVYVSGHSAGGYLTAMLAMDPKYLARHDLRPTDLAGYMPVSGQMITHSTVREERGVSEFQPIVDDASPAFYARKDTPRILCIAGSDDLPARAEENRWFVAALRNAGHADSEYVEFAGRNHTTIASDLDEPNDVVAAKMKAFMSAGKAVEAAAK